ncbi:MAG TPA: type II 3-dehydroquinate dehydratase [Candidatus Dormibacteraeota bacterium]|nr:type II 3-dehydroquinate dehydratase [Candidatus Dormibacteraeota bacterium]
MKRILVVNGPNLNLLGTREPEVYGTTTLAEIEAMVRARAAELGNEVMWFQSNHEGAIVDFLQREGPSAAGIVLNPAALTHYSVALYDCLKALTVPTVEVHISNLHRRAEGFRTRDVTAAAAVGVIQGLGPRGYLMAMEYLVDRDE